MRCKKLISFILAAAMLFSFASFACAANPTVLPFENSAFFEMGDYSIHYRTINGEGEFAGRIVFIHGMISSTVFWEDMAAIMAAEGYDCVLVDLPGFGYSTRETRDVEPIPREELVAGLMREIAGEEKWIVAGHSMGGGASLTIAQKYPELIESLLLYAPAGGSTGGGMNLSEPFTYIAGSFMNMMYKLMLTFASTSFVSSYVKDMFGYGADYDLYGKWIAPLKLENTGMSMMYMMQRVTAIDYGIINALEMPIFLCLAENDSIVPMDSSNALAVEDNLPAHAVKAVVPGADHVFVELQAEEVAALTLEFLA